ncbi:MAG TPA: putative zinc-binding metallopeptidase [Gammaproteobacteria bacterium]|nr:putative zinc-binding metallopeptidase [Gammaproteobacteria bacterium]
MSARARAARASHRWERLDDAALLRVRFRDLGLKIFGSPVHTDALRLGEQLERRGIRFKPHLWFSTDWFSPDGVPGIAVPFFLGHPRLLRLERRMMGEAEGGNRRWRLRLLRHELGHAVDTAFGLRRRRDWQQVFGSAGARYSRDYTVRPGSEDYVLHLEHWYAQSHPTEDFAETFAVWLQPKARWRVEYAGWPALAKLEFVDRLMADLAGRAPSKRDRSFIAPLTDNSRTLGEHYRRRGYLSEGGEQRYDPWLMRVFAPRSASASAAISAARLLSDVKPQLMRTLLRRTRAHPYLVFQVLRAVRRRARSLDPVLRGSKREALHEVTRLHERVIVDLLRRNEETYFL